jgi:DNA repair exonuclease SbcCD nuclease subunit
MTARIFHIADVHLRDSANASTERGEDFKNAVISALDKAAELKVNAVTIGGDFLNSPKTSSKVVDAILNIQETAKAHKLPVYLITGNHDQSEPPWSETLERLTGKSEYGLISADRKLIKIPETDVTIYGLPFMSKEQLKEALMSAPKADVLLWHGTVKDFIGFPDENAACLEDLDSFKGSIILLGDLHIWDWKRTPSGIVCGYSGSTELTNKSEPLKKYAALVEVTSGIKSEVPKQVAIPTRTVKVFKIATEEDLGRVLSELETEKPDWKKPPLVFVSYNPEILGVINRVRNILPAGAIVRYSAFAEADKNFAGEEYIMQHLSAEKELASLLEAFLHAASPIYEIAKSLLNPSANAKEILENYVSSKLHTKI